MCKATFKTAKTRLHHMKHKHSLCVTAPSSSSTLAGQQVKPGQPIITQAPMGQPTFLHMEPLGPHQQVDNIDTEQIRKLIESLGNVRKVNQVEEQVQQVKLRKKKVKKQKDVINETHSEQISSEQISEQEVIAPPKPKKKKQQKIRQEDQPKKTKGQKRSKTGRKKKKPNMEASPISEDMPDPEIKQQSLLLLKGHKQPQLKVYKLDASKAPQGQTDPQQDQDTHPIHKKKGPKSKQLKMLAAGGNRKVGRPKKSHTALSMLAPLKATPHSSDTSPTKPKTSRKRKAPKVETEGIISGSHSRRALECKDCGERFSDVSSLQEHKAALHAVESPGLTYTNGNIFEGVSGSDLGQPPLKVTEEVIENSLSQNTFGMQVASDWDIEVEMRERGLGERGERVSFPALNPSPSLPLAAALVEAPLHSCHQTEDTKSESQGNMNDTAETLIPTVSGSEHLGPIEDEIKEELLLEVDLVTVGGGDQNEGEHQSSPHEDSSHNEGSSLHDNNSTHALPTHAQIENVNTTVTTQNAQTESCPSDPLEIKQEEEEIMVQRREEEKREVGRNNYTRGRRRGVGRGRRGSATRKSLEGEGMREMEPEKETDECRVVYQLYSLTNDTEIKDEADVTTLHPGQSSPISLQTEIRSISEQNTQTAPCPSRSCIPLLEEDPEDQVVFELESVTTSVVEVLKTEDGMVMKGVAGDQEQQRYWPIPRHHTGEVPHLKAERGSSRGEWSGAHGRLERQCIFYPVKEEESELLEEPSQSEQGVPVLVVPGESRLNHPVEDLSITNPDVEEYEVNRRAAKLGTEINEYGEGDLDFEQQDTEELVDFLLQNSDAVESGVVECCDPQPDPEAVVMACYHDSQNHASLHSNEIPNNLPTTKSQADSGSTGGSQTGTGYMKPIDYFSKYFGWDTWAEIARCTNKVSHLSNPVTAKEVAQFVGIHIAMGTLKFPSLKLYWQDFTRVPLVADTMSASRFSQLSCKLQLASPAPAGDPMDTHEAGHSDVHNPSQQLAEVWGHNHPARTVLVLKLTPFGRAVNNKRPSLHSTVLVGSDSLILDFNLSLDLSIKEATVEKMVPREGMVYLCKQELSTPAMLEHLLGSGVHGAGKVGGAKGQMGDEFVSSDGRLMLHRYHLGFILSTVGKAQQNMASLVDSFEKAQKAASLNRDLINLYHSPLSTSAPTSWPQAVLWYLTDLALVNSWMQYRQDHVPLPEPLNLMAFRLEVSKALVLSSGSDTQDSAPPHPPPQKLHAPGTAPDPGLLQESPLPDVATRYDGSGHWPEQLGDREGGRCRFGGYQHENLQCFQCFITFCNSKAKERHMKKSHREEYKQQLQQGDTLFTCYVCDRTFPSSEELTQHQGSHNKEDKPFKCPHCQESFRTFSELTTHRRQVCPERQFVCKDCSETFRSPALLRTHRLAQHPRPEAEVEEPDDPTKTHRCGKCNRGFETESELIMHQENHAGDQHCNGGASPAKKRGRPIKAEDTAVGEKKGKRRKKKEEGTEEAETGNNAEEAAAAPAETKGKAAAGGRRGRPKATAGEEAREDDSEVPAEEKKPKAAPAPPKQHPCPECELTFHALAQLRAHKKEKHTPRKAHPCEECEESFARAEQLEAHKNRAHTKGRYACPTCGKSFGRESNLKAHQQSSHPEEEEKEAAGRSKR
ncbi:unnamed protein product [Coregonus sp. 'balchen']|nr:unnamed protein product [Coregonus sp. 'balchen']